MDYYDGEIENDAKAKDEDIEDDAEAEDEDDMAIQVTILIQVHSIINLSLKEDKINPIGQFARFVVKMVI